jgi:hypothetical protein
MKTTHQRLPSFSNWILLMPRSKGFALWAAPRFVAAEHLCHISETLSVIHNSFFVERIFGKDRARITNEFVNVPGEYHVRAIREPCSPP